jgi:hypothetical protein
MIKKKKYRRIIGASLLPIGALMLVSTFYPCIYWSNPLVFMSFSALAPLSAFFGPFLLLNSERKRRLLFLVPGGILTSAGMLGWLASIAGAIEISTTGYWGAGSCGGFNINGYNGDYLMLGLQIVVFIATVAASFLGGLFTGIGFGKRVARVET